MNKATLQLKLQGLLPFDVAIYTTMLKGKKSSLLYIDDIA